MADLDLLSLVTRIRATYPPRMTPEQVGEALCRIAFEAGPRVGVLLKSHGHGVPSPVGTISADILVDREEEQEYDVFVDAGGTTDPVWQKLPVKVGKCRINPDTGKEECSGASMANVVPVLVNPVAGGPTPPEESPEDDFSDDVDDAIVPVLVGIEDLGTMLASTKDLLIGEFEAMRKQLAAMETKVDDTHTKVTQTGFKFNFFGKTITIR